MARGNGWRTGRDPIQRWLRIVSGIVLLVVFSILTIDPSRGVDAAPTAALALGGLLILLGYESLIRLPWIGKGDNSSKDDTDEHP